MKEVTPQQAYDLQRQGYAYLDVRSEQEFAAGHPAGAVNIPIAFKTTQGMQANPNFIATVKKNFGPDAKLLLGCLAGGRSANACNLLEQAGYSELINVAGGFGGGRSAVTGQVIAGWSQSGLPIETGPRTLS